MAADIHIGDLWYPNATSYTITEDSTPIDVSDTSGGIGQATFSFIAPSGWKSFLRRIFRLKDSSLGTTQGTVRSMASSNGILTITADSRMTAMTAEKTAQPFTGKLGDALTYYFSLVGITSGIVIDPTIRDNPVALPGWQGEVWFYIAKKLAPVLKFEISLVSDNIVVRPWRGRVAVTYRDISQGDNIDQSETARFVEIYYYNGLQKNNSLVYPAGGWNDRVEIYDVNANEIKEIPLEMSASLTSIQQPTVVDFVARDFKGASVYAIAGADGLPITSAQWNGMGGKVSVKINEDTRSLTLTITGPNSDQYAPYRIAMSSSTSNFYSSLRLVGTGIIFDKKLLTTNTAVSDEAVSQDYAPTIDNEFVNTITDAFDTVVWATARWTGPKRTISFSAKGIHRRGDSGSYRYPTLADWNALYAGKTLADLNVIWAGKTIRQLNEYLTSLVADDFDNQAFGNVAGARIYRDFAWYRIRNSTQTPDGISGSAEADTTIRDLNEVWDGATIADLNAQWYGKALRDFTMQPLRRD